MSVCISIIISISGNINDQALVYLQSLPKKSKNTLNVTQINSGQNNMDNINLLQRADHYTNHDKEQKNNDDDNDDLIKTKKK